MGRKLDKLTIRGFKSIQQLEDFELGDLNVMVGANGSGKSNFVEFFRLLRAMVQQHLQVYILKNGPADGFFFDGVAHTRKIEVDLTFGQNRYVFTLAPTKDGTVFIESEDSQYLGGGSLKQISRGALESHLKSKRDERSTFYPGAAGPNSYVWDAVSGWQVYHFHDTSMTAGMRRDSGVEQGEVLQPDASNLAAFLLNLRENEEENFQLIRKTLQRIAPYFDDFVPTVKKHKQEDQVRLTWTQKGKDYIFSPGHFSDGTIRFLCLATVILQPYPPATIVLDEPELGLHPEAITVLGGLLRSASHRMQVIVATQSPQLLAEFEPEQIITVDQVEGASQFRRLDTESLDAWLEDYSVAELWQKGNIAGGINDA